MTNGTIINYGTSNSAIGNFIVVELENGTGLLYGHLDSFSNGIANGISGSCCK